MLAVLTVAFGAVSPNISSASTPTDREIASVVNDDVTVWFVPGAAVRPMSASDCDGDVCIAVYGDYNYIGTWDTQAYYNGTGTKCTVPHYIHFTLANGATEVRTGGQLCASTPGVFYAEWNPNRNFDNGLAINTWDGFTGSPNVVINSL